MNLSDIIDPETGLQLDEWCLSKPTLGKDNQLEVIGWSGRNKGGRGDKYYIVKCSKCSEDDELFGEGCFRSMKTSLVKGLVPCGCARSPRWSTHQFAVMCSRKAEQFGYMFLGFSGEWRCAYTKIKMLCEKHGEWCSGRIDTLINAGKGCPGCKCDAVAEANTKSDDIMIASFLNSGTFHPETKFWRSGRKTNQGNRVYWHVSCPECGEQGESTSCHLQQGKRPCGCSRHRQKEAYINWVVGEQNQAVALKIGIATCSTRRVTQQNSFSVYEIRNHSIYTFPDVSSCKAAERECKQTLECGVLSKEEMPDGYTETTSVLNLGRIKRIYEKHGGILQGGVE